MRLAIIRLFIFISGIILAVTSVAKLISSTGKVPIQLENDPILLITFSQVFLAVGVVELVIALVCFLCKQVNLQLGLVAWLATSLVVYRISLIWVGYHKPCTCLGNLTDALHITPTIFENAMKIILAYLFIGSYATLFYLLWQKRKALPLAPPA